jgi:hypothetical protein
VLAITASWLRDRIQVLLPDPGTPISMKTLAISILVVLRAMVPHGLWDAQAQRPEQIHHNSTNYCAHEYSC